jgi:hypothetical protein
VFAGKQIVVCFHRQTIGTCVFFISVKLLLDLEATVPVQIHIMYCTYSRLTILVQDPACKIEHSTISFQDQLCIDHLFHSDLLFQQDRSLFRFSFPLLAEIGIIPQQAVSLRYQDESGRRRCPFGKDHSHGMTSLSSAWSLFGSTD